MEGACIYRTGIPHASSQRGSIGCRPRGVPVNRPIKGNVHMTVIENNNNFENHTWQKLKSIATFDHEMLKATGQKYRVYEEISAAATDINIASETCKGRLNGPS